MKNKLFAKLTICKECNKIHGQQNEKRINNMSIVVCLGSRISTAQCQADLKYLGRNLSY